MAMLVENVLYIATLIAAAYFFIGMKFEKNWWKYALAAVLAVGFMVYIFFVDIVFVNLIGMTVLLYALIRSLFGEKRLKSLVFVFVFINVYNIFVEIMDTTIKVFSMVFEKRPSDSNRIVNCFLVFAFFLILGILARKYTLIGTGKVKRKYLLLIIAVIAIDSITISVMGVIFEEMGFSSVNAVLFLVYILIVFLVLVEILAITYLAASRNEHMEREALVQNYLEEQKLHYEYLSKREYETKKFRHDIANHLSLIASMCKEGDLEGISRYLDEINAHAGKTASKINTHNDIADAILNRYHHDCNESGIDMKVEGHFPPDCRIAAFDICTIMSNLLDNALLAEKLQGGSQIYVSIRNTDDDKVLIVVENDFDQAPIQEKGRFITSKRNQEDHGFGIENVKECVKRYNGFTNITAEDGKFRVWICMENK